MTEINKNLTNLYCAFPGGDQHFVLEPILLGCGHYFCNSCVSNRRLKNVKCNICCVMNAYDSLLKTIDNESSSEILSEAFEILKMKFNAALSDLKNTIGGKQKKLAIDIKYAKEEIEIKVESLKDELEKCKDSLYDKLDEYEELFNSEIESIEKTNYDAYALNLNDISRVNQNEFQTHVEVLKKLQDDLDLFKASFIFKFEPSEANIPSGLVANIDFLRNLQHEKIDMSMLNDFKLIEGFWFNGGCVLPNGHVAFYNYSEPMICDGANHELVRSIDAIHGQSINTYSMLTYEDTYIYILDSERIIMTDIDFNYLNDCQLGISFEDDNQVMDYGDFRLYKENFYILCYLKSNYGVLKISRDFNSRTMKIIEYDHGILSMHILNDLIMFGGKELVVFYTLDDFQKKSVYTTSGEIDKLFVYNNYFYAVDIRQFTAYCYDQSGLFVDEIIFPITSALKELCETHGQGCFFNSREKTITFTVEACLHLVYKIK